MEDLLKNLFPFLTRKMLSFEHGQSFGLRITTQATIATTFTIRGFTREGIFSFTKTDVGSGSASTSNFRIPDIPIFVSVIDTTALLNQAESYVTLSLTVNNDVLYELAAGPVYRQKAISWPPSGGLEPIPDHGRFRIVSTANPAAGAEISQSVPTGRIWNILACTFTLVTDGNVANRRVHLTFTDGSAFEIESYPTIDQTATQTFVYNCAQWGSLPDETDGDNINIIIPQNIYLPEAGTIETRTTNRQATDNFNSAQILIEEFVIPQL